MIGLLAAAVMTAAFAAGEPARCAPVEVTMLRQEMPAKFTTTLMRRTSANFAEAYRKACTDGLMKKEALVTVKGANAKRIFLFNAPEANVASIYAHGGRMLIEYPFVSADGKAQVPTADELHEAIFCTTQGASAKEQEESGRCLPD